ncbi:MAG TPA: hypothetical protein DDW91_04130 [Shewanella frigidimarina]|nr:hypothetical protein [Shewanella frigidimarina]
MSVVQSSCAYCGVGCGVSVSSNKPKPERSLG